MEKFTPTRENRLAQISQAAELLVAARRARSHAYAPYSGFCVGAAVLCANGEIVTGANIENASYGLSVCAERTALFSAIAKGHRSFTALAIVGPEGLRISPCGACRQAIAEFGEGILIVREASDDVPLRDLLPDAFGAETLERAHL
jgi:cytidine deaminase